MLFNAIAPLALAATASAVVLPNNPTNTTNTTSVTNNMVSLGYNMTNVGKKPFHLIALDFGTDEPLGKVHVKPWTSDVYSLVLEVFPGVSTSSSSGPSNTTNGGLGKRQAVDDDDFTLVPNALGGTDLELDYSGTQLKLVADQTNDLSGSLGPTFPTVMASQPRQTTDVLPLFLNRLAFLSDGMERSITFVWVQTPDSTSNLLPDTIALPRSTDWQQQLPAGNKLVKLQAIPIGKLDTKDIISKHKLTI